MDGWGNGRNMDRALLGCNRPGWFLERRKGDGGVGLSALYQST